MNDFTNKIRFSAFLWLGAALLLAATANAQATFSMTGKAATGSGAFVDLPAIGNAACPSIVGKIGFASMNPQPMTAPLVGPVPLNPGGCIPGGPVQVMTNGTGGFTFPANFFLQPFPGGTMGGTAMDLQVTPVPDVPQVLQLASSFKFDGPRAVPFEPRNPVVTMAPYAAWRVFKHNAWMSQTGRAGKTFTACAGTVANLACTIPQQGTFPAIVKNFGGPVNGFGGTMGLVLTTSPTQDSSLAVKIGAAQTIILQILAGQGSRAPGRGYAAYDTDLLMPGPLFLMYMLTTMVAPPNNVIATVMTPLGLGPAGTNRNFGFPWTTGQIIVRGTGSNGMGVPNGATVTADGFDTMTGMGARNIQLVAGGVAQSSIQGPNGTPNYTVVRLPEPGAALQLLAGVVGLLGIGAWRARKVR